MGIPILVIRHLYTETPPLSFSVTSSALRQLYDYPGGQETTPKNARQQIIGIHLETEAQQYKAQQDHVHMLGNILLHISNMINFFGLGHVC